VEKRFLSQYGKRTSGWTTRQSGFNYRIAEILRHLLPTTCTEHQASCSMDTEVSPPVVKWLAFEADNLTPLGAKVKKSLSCTSVYSHTVHLYIFFTRFLTKYSDKFTLHFPSSTGHRCVCKQIHFFLPFFSFYC
jgi:hypothetical protein